jgi:hypothetical protein
MRLASATILSSSDEPVGAPGDALCGDPHPVNSTLAIATNRIAGRRYHEATGDLRLRSGCALRACDTKGLQPMVEHSCIYAMIAAAGSVDPAQVVVFTRIN